MELIVSIHSMIDVITNSSTELFIVMNNNAVKGMYEILNNVLEIAGSNKKAEDLFDISIEPNLNMVFQQYVEEFVYPEYHEGSKEKFTELDKNLLEEYNKIKDWKEKDNFASKRIIPYLRDSGKWRDFNVGYEEQELQTSLKITPKNENLVNIDLWKKIEKLFYIQEYSTD